MVLLPQPNHLLRWEPPSNPLLYPGFGCGGLGFRGDHGEIVV